MDIWVASRTYVEGPSELVGAFSSLAAAKQAIGGSGRTVGQWQSDGEGGVWCDTSSTDGWTIEKCALGEPLEWLTDNAG